jgi:glucose/mannose-6-phosphate isomerase
MTQLDTQDSWSALDPSDMYGKILRFPDQVTQAIEIGRTCNLGKLSGDGIRQIVVSGLGGSAIGGDLVRSYLSDQLTLPMLVVRDYALPKFVGPSTLVLASSYSGTTEETLSAYDQAHRAGCRMLAFTTGGTLAEKAQADGHPVVTLPGGLMPRAALAFSFFPILLCLSRLGLAAEPGAELEETAALLAQKASLYSRSTNTDRNPAKQTATAWQGRVPLIYGAHVRFDAVALRIKCQIAENAKQLAFANVFPEFNHNELVGFGKTQHLAGLLSVCILRDRGDHRRIGIRMAIVRKMIADLGVPAVDVHSSGTSALARMFSLVQWGDFVSYYLAVLNGVDPTPIAAIDHLKRELSERT